MSDEQEHVFTATIDEINFGRMAYAVIYLPPDVFEGLRGSGGGRPRVDGEIAGEPFHGGVQPAGGGRHYVMVSKTLRKACGRGIGDRVRVRLWAADPDRVDVPDELRFALDGDDAARRVWEGWTAGRRRGAAHRVASAKRVATRELRVEDVLEELRGGDR